METLFLSSTDVIFYCGMNLLNVDNGVIMIKQETNSLQPEEMVGHLKSNLGSRGQVCTLHPPLPPFLFNFGIAACI